MDPTARQSILDRLKQASNVLVTVKNGPSVDQLAGCVGLTLFLNKIDKHATAVFSGDVPSTLEFLKPEETIEKTTDSLRDFIIALDKSKADKLRYKVENDVVKIFITPYRTNLSEKDFDFSQGDFNVDVVIALGVHAKEDLDQAIVAHGRILHDATIISLNNGPGGQLGTLHLEDPQASSLCEMLATLCEGLQPNSFDPQMATAFLTGIVAETERFSKPNTSPQTMTLSAKLMAAGANQQLIATQLSADQVAGPGKGKKKKKDEEGTLTIEHEEEGEPEQAEETTIELPEPVNEDEVKAEEKPAIKKHAEPKVSVTPLPDLALDAPPSSSAIKDVRSQPDEGGLAGSQPAAPPKPTAFPLEPPTMGGTLTANTQKNVYDPSTDPLTLGSSQVGQTMSHGTPSIGGPVSTKGAVADDEPLTDIEKAVNSPHQDEAVIAQNAANASLDEARQAVESAAATQPTAPEPPQALGAQILGDNLQGSTPPPVPVPAPTPAPVPTPAMPPMPVPAPVPTPTPVIPPTGDSSLSSIPPDLVPSTPLLNPTPGLDVPTSLVPPDAGPPPEQTGTSTTQPAPPPVPPPMPFVPPTPPTT